jgi:hypothetical protein
VRNYYGDSRDRGSVDLGSSHATIHLPGKTQPEVARILHRRQDAQGKDVHVVLDRVVHGDHQTTIGEWSAVGVVVTELFLGKPDIRSDR